MSAAPSPSAMLASLKGRRIAISGAGAGIGRELALGFAREGAVIVVTDRSLNQAQAVAGQIVAIGGQASALELDVTDAAACHRVAAETTTLIGPIQTLINNAGIGERAHLGEANFMEEWHKTLRVNLDGVMNMTLGYLEQIKKTKGTIVNMSSICATHIGAATPAYGASKGAIMQLTRALARDLAPFGVRVNALAPGMIETAMTQSARLDETRMARTTARSMMKRIGRPDEIVGPAAFLASEMSSFVTGSLLYVDGGFTAI